MPGNIKENTYFVPGIILCICIIIVVAAMFEYLLGERYYVLHKSSYIYSFQYFNEVDILSPFYIRGNIFSEV